MTVAEQESLDLYKALGVLLDRMNIERIELSRRELDGLMRWVHCDWTPEGNLSVYMTEVGNMGIEGAAATCPWPPDQAPEYVIVGRKGEA